MKNNSYGKARVLDKSQVIDLFAELSKNPRDACLFAICFFTACRISEALQLHTQDFMAGTITLRKATTKGKLKSRTIPIHAALEPYLLAYQPKKPGAMFPGQCGMGNTYLDRVTAHRILRSACKKIGIVGVSTHSFRRTALTFMSENGTPLREIQEVSGHADLGTLQKYLEVTPAQTKRAVNSIWL
jgi:integrase/recombinase XerD